MTNKQNFVAVSGISDSRQLKGICRICQEEKINFPISIGYQVSNKSINQGTQNPRQPKFIELGNLNKQTLDYGFVPSFHYYGKDHQLIINDLEQIAEMVHPTSALVQFNTLPPSENILRRAKDIGFNIIFKVAVSNKQSLQGGYKVWKGDDVQDVREGNTDPLVSQVQKRKKFLDYAMFDPSHGTNLELDLNENSLAIKFGQKIISDENLNNLGLVYAGGINPNNVKQITKTLLSFFPQDRISIDIESGVRIENNLDLNLIRRYLVGYNEAIK